MRLDWIERILRLERVESPGERDVILFLPSQSSSRAGRFSRPSITRMRLAPSSRLRRNWRPVTPWILEILFCTK